MTDGPRGAQQQRALMGLRAYVLSGDVEPGSRLSEPQLAERLGLSRTPLRAAMSILVEEGLLERAASGGCRVRKLAPGDIHDTIQLRGSIEGVALRRAAEQGVSAADLAPCISLADDIDDALGKTADTVDFDAYAELNDAFHRAFVALCRSDVLIHEYERITRLPMAAPSSFLQAQAAMSEIRQSLFMAQIQHRAMLAAVRSKHGSRAEALAREHAYLAHDNLQAVLGAKDQLQDTVPGLALVAASAAS
jgi:GntR family transcriptional regulator of vanillate catabolism